MSEPSMFLPDTCPFFFDSTGTDEGGTILLDAGIRLEKAPGYDNHGGGSDKHLPPAATICLDRDGRVTHTFLSLPG